MPRPNRQRHRGIARAEGKFRDHRLLILATEDTYAPKQYFELLQTELNTPRVSIVVAESTDGRTAPRHVLERLKAKIKEVGHEPGDEHWMLIDRDHYFDGTQSNETQRVLKEAEQAGIHVAISNPCFEAWLLLHHTEYRPSQQIKCSQIEPLIRNETGEFNKKRLNPAHYPMATILLAIERTRDLDTKPEERSLREFGSRIYKLVESLFSIAGFKPR